MNEAAQALGRLAKGKPKVYTEAGKAALRERLAKARLKRWPAKLPDPAPPGDINTGIPLCNAKNYG